MYGLLKWSMQFTMQVRVLKLSKSNSPSLIQSDIYCMTNKLSLKNSKIKMLHVYWKRVQDYKSIELSQFYSNTSVGLAQDCLLYLHSLCTDVELAYIVRW